MVATEILRTLEAKTAALIRRDADALDALLDPGFTYVNAGGRVLDKAAFIETYCLSDQVVFLAQETADLRVTPHDGFAVATLALHDRFMVQGRIVEGDYRSLCVFRRAPLGWLWAAGQTMPDPTR